MTKRVLGVAAVGIGAIAVILLARKAKAAPQPEPGTGDERIVVAQISAKQDETGITATIRWRHRIPGLQTNAAFVDMTTSMGRVENGVWNNYHTVSAQGDVPLEGEMATLTAFWGQAAVAQMPEGLAGIRCQIHVLTAGWQVIASSPWYVAENVIEIK